MTSDKPPIPRAELISLLAMLMATVAFSIDAMLPSLPEIGQDLSPSDPNRAQLVLAAFIFGMGFGTLFAGPLSDAWGRKPIAVGGAVLYTGAALIGAISQDIETLLIARFIQGLGAAGPRVTAVAIARDLFSGRHMAQVMSYVIFVFTLVPIFAPTLGWSIAWAFGWRAIFMAFALFSIISMVWLVVRLPETLATEHRRPFRFALILDGLRQVFSARHVVLAMAAQTLILSILFATLMSSQQSFDIVLGRGDEFPLWFGAMAVLAASSNLVNARIVMRLGMAEVVKRTLLVHGIGTFLFLALQLAGALEGTGLFVVAFAWFTSVFFLAGFCIGNVNAIAMEPMGHIAGLAASIVAAISTVGSALIAAPIGQAFNGTLLPLTSGALGLVTLAFLLVRKLTEAGIDG